MRTILTCLLLSSSAVTLAEEEVLRFTFPPFASEEMKIPTQPLPDYPSYEQLKGISLEELRGIMATKGSPDMSIATRELLERGDQETILRLVYSLKQGNVRAIGMLSGAPLATVPYLMEEVAHGSLQNYGSYIFGDAATREGRVREAAVDRVASILSMAPEFTGETRECLQVIARGSADRIQTLSDKSRYLLEWWLLNANAFEAGKWEETQPLPRLISYLHPKDDNVFPRHQSLDTEKQPPYGSPMWELAEPFEKWSERIVDPHRRNLDFVALSWDGKRVIEHPAKSLDPRGRPLSVKDREARRSPTPINPSESVSGDGVKGIVWITGAAVLIVVLAILWWMRRRFAAEV